MFGQSIGTTRGRSDEHRDGLVPIQFRNSFKFSPRINGEEIFRGESSTETNGIQIFALTPGWVADVAERSIGSSGWLDSVSSLVSIDTDDQISLRQNAAQRCGNGDLPALLNLRWKRRTICTFGKRRELLIQRSTFGGLSLLEIVLRPNRRHWQRRTWPLRNCGRSVWKAVGLSSSSSSVPV